MTWRRVEAIGGALVVVACGGACGARAFACEDNASCGADGRCEPIGYCSFPDPRCPSGRRFGEHAPANLAVRCTSDTPIEPSDSGADDVSNASTNDAMTTTDVDASTLALTLTSGATSASSDDAGDPSSSSSGEPSTLAEGLVLHLPLDDDFTARGAAMDTSGNALHAQCPVAMCPTSVPGRVGMAAGFARDAALVIPDAPLLRPADAFSVSIWALDVDPDSLETQFVVGKVIGDVYNTFQISTSFTVERNNRMVWRITDVGPTHAQTYIPNPLEPTTWHHLAGVWDGATSTLYVDGEIVGEAPASAVEYGPGPFTIGADDNDGLLYFYRGALDEVRFYDRALTPAEVAELAAQ